MINLRFRCFHDGHTEGIQLIDDRSETDRVDQFSIRACHYLLREKVEAKSATQHARAEEICKTWLLKDHLARKTKDSGPRLCMSRVVRDMWQGHMSQANAY